MAMAGLTRRRHARLGLAALVALCAVLAVPRPARAAIKRFAVIIGNDVGDRQDGELRYAEDDAAKIYSVLKNLGGFRPEDMLLLQGESASTVRRAIISMNDRIRRHAGAGNAGSMLVVYYSGHADASDLHLGNTPFELEELEALVQGSAAAFRILMLDACRSGTLTRVKGGQIAPPLSISVGPQLASEGTVFLTASAANEDAQESDEIKGSFFTHYLVSGLVGAADANRDGHVTLEEAYRYTYQHTLRASSRTLAGTQHPTFRYDLRGQGHLVLTSVVPASRQAIVNLPPGRTYLLMQGDPDGPVIAEVNANDSARRISVTAGRYFVRGRARDYLLEGTVQLEGGKEQTVDDDRLERIQYARFVRKGISDVRMVHGPQLGMGGRPTLFKAGPCLGPYVGYAFETARFDLVPRVSWCSSAADAAGNTAGDQVGPRDTEISAELRLSHTWDMSRVSLGVGIAPGIALLADSAIGNGGVLGRYRPVGMLGTTISIAADLVGSAYVAMDLSAETYVQRRNLVIVDATPQTGQPAYELRSVLDSELVLRLGGGVGMRW